MVEQAVALPGPETILLRALESRHQQKNPMPVACQWPTRMGGLARVPDLQEDEGALVAHGLHNRLPRLHLLVLVDPWACLGYLPGTHQSSEPTLREMGTHQSSEPTLREWAPFAGKGWPFPGRPRDAGHAAKHTLGPGSRAHSQSRQPSLPSGPLCLPVAVRADDGGLGW